MALLKILSARTDKQDKISQLCLPTDSWTYTVQILTSLLNLSMKWKCQCHSRLAPKLWTTLEQRIFNIHSLLSPALISL